MKQNKKIFFSILLLLSCFLGYSQVDNGISIKKKNGEVIKFTGNYVQDKNSIVITEYDENNNKSVKKYDLNTITEIIKGDNVYIVKKEGVNNVIVETIISGNLNFYKDNKGNYYLEDTKNGFKKLPADKTKNTPVFKSGFISLYTNNCKEVVNELYRDRYVVVSKLKKLLIRYNQCKVSDKQQIADDAIFEANKKNERIEFALSGGYSIQNAVFEESISETVQFPRMFFGGVFYFHSGILNNNRLDFNLAVNYYGKASKFTQKENPFSSLSYTSENYSIMLGANYMLANSEKSIRPYFGVSGGLMVNSKSEIEIAVSEDLPRKVYASSNYFPFFINVGSLIKLYGHKIDVTFEYFPSRKVSIRDINSIDTKYIDYKLSGFNIKLSYIIRLKKRLDN